MPSVVACDLFGEPLTILILSPQTWDGLQVSKHHYARELAALGHHVLFLNPQGGADRITLNASDTPGVTLVDHPQMAFARAKFRARWLFDLAARPRARAIRRAVGKIDLLWDFDNAGQFADHRPFDPAMSILHLVDRLKPGDGRLRNADVLIGVDASMLDDLAPNARPRLVVGHGLAPLFADVARQALTGALSRKAGKRITVGAIGNLAHPVLDRTRTMRLVKDHPDVQFRFLGPLQGGMSAEYLRMQAWVDALRQNSNVELPGLLTGSALIEAAADVDVWLLCYDPAVDHNRSVNSHKLLEYFSTGAQVVSSYISAQEGAPGVFMAPAEAPDRIFDLFHDALAAVRAGRDTGARERIEIALSNSYSDNLRRIARHLDAAARAAAPCELSRDAADGA